MKMFSREELKSLIAAENGPCVSTYVNTAKAGSETLENPARFRSRLREAQDALERRGVKSSQAVALLKPATDLANDFPFSQEQDHGLAVFLCPDFMRAYKIPYDVKPLTVVGLGFHLKPLLPLLADDRAFMILALSKKAVNLYRGTRYTITQVPLPDIPHSESEALRYENPEKSLHVHTSGTDSSEPGIFHGQGSVKEDAKERTLRYFHRVAAGLQGYLRNEHVPLVLAGVEYYLPIYRKANRYAHLIDEVVAGNPDATPLGQLHQAAWLKVEPIFRRDRERSAAAIESGLQNAQATQELEPAVAAAFEGRVDKCFVALNEQRWGAYNASSGSVELLDKADPRACDLLDLAAVQTVLQGGETFPFNDLRSMPGQKPLSVLLRYPNPVSQPARSNDKIRVGGYNATSFR
jgi:hypothetical protein